MAKAKKLPPPKKMSPKEAKAAAKRNSAAIQGKPVTKPRIKKTAATPLPKAYVFYDCHRHVYLLLTEGEKFNRYLTTGNDGFCVVKLEHGSPIRDEKGHLPEDTTRVGDLTVYEDYDLKKATQKFHSSFLPRSNEAEREMCAILGKPLPTVSEEVKAVRKAAGERLAASRPHLDKPGDKAQVTLVLGGKASAPSARAGKILKLLGNHKKGLSVAELCDQIGVPIYATVAKLAELGLVQVKK